MSTGPHELPELDVREAMDRALEAERNGLAAVAGFERESALALEQARQWRRALLERTGARIGALHARVGTRMAQRATAILEERRRTASAEAALLADPERRRLAIERLAARLTSDGE